MPDLPADVVDALSLQFQLERQLGLGGMATVYLARDLKHKRPVALKLLHVEHGSSLGPRRFRLEIETAARLHHPHICPVYDSGETWPGSGGGTPRLWFTMPFVAGGTLRDRLRRDGRLPIDEALRIVRETADALQYAHDEGVIHRDIKPENVLLSHNQSVLVADFGVARPVDPPDGGHITGAGLVVGTPTYMAPEQAVGEKPVDARADQYALAATAYEMLAGKPPIVGSTATAILSIRYTQPLPSLRAARPEVPEAVDEAIARALSMEPAKRFGSVAEFARALETGSPPRRRRRYGRGVMAAGAVAAVLLAGGAFAWRTMRPGPGRNGPPVVNVLAVLPFENVGDSADAYFADGVTDEVRAKLAEVDGLDVIARSSSSEYRHTGKTPEAIARELGADYVLTGTVRWEKSAGASRVRVIPELVEVRAGGAPRTRWGRQFDAAITDVFAVQADIAGRVVEALDLALAADARVRLASLPTRNVDAYTAYLRGRELGSAERTPEALRGALAEFERAVTLDSTFSAAWAELAQAQLDVFLHGGTQPKDAEAAARSVERARALAPQSPETRLASGRSQLLARGDAVAALAEYRAGLSLAPAHADLLSATADAELHLGRWADGITDLEHAARLDPRSPVALGALADAYGRLGRFREAGDAIARARALRPSSMSLAYTNARIAAARGRVAEAREILRAMEPIHGARTVVAYVALREDLIWALDDGYQRILLQLTPSDLDGGRADWALALAETYWLRGARGLARGYGETAVAEFAKLLSGWGERGGRGQILALRAMSLAYAGRLHDAVTEGERSNEIQPPGERVAGPYTRYLLARIHLMAGNPDKAMDAIEALLREPDFVRPPWIRVDPTLAGLKKSARYWRAIGTSR